MLKNEPLKVIFFVRLFSAFEKSVHEGRWNPEGMPTVSKLWEKLQKEGIPFEVHCTAGTEIFEGNQKIKIEELKAHFYIYTPLLRGHWGFLQFLVNRLNSIWMKAYAFLKIQHNNTNGVFYVDRENVVLGAVLSLIGKKVVLRLHGVAVLYRKFTNLKDSLKTPIRKWAFKAPFSVIIATEDGSPVFEFIQKFINPKVRGEVMVNGVSIEPDEYLDIRIKHGINFRKPIVLFVSRLVKGKGIEVFFKSIFKLLDNDFAFNAVIVGEGDFKEHYKKMSKEYQSVFFTGAVPHNLIMNYYQQSDIFVSLNMLGDLPNTVLEAIGGENCIILLRTKHNSNHNEKLDRLIKDKVQIINEEDIEKELYHSIKRLLGNDTNKLKCIANGRKLKTSLVRTWEERMNFEIDILTRI